MTGGRLLAILGGMMLAVAGLGYLVWKHGSALECVDRTIREYSPPDRRYVAVHYERDCGGSVATHLGLRSTGSSDAKPDDVFVSAGHVDLQVLDAANEGLLLGISAPNAIAPVAKWKHVGVAYIPARRDPCETSGQCKKGFECLLGGSPGLEEKSCYRVCDQSGRCPEGFECKQPLDGPRHCRLNLRAPNARP